ncbi:MAG: helix-turn-helix transcriptional regulator [Verrucomicrobiales bacterium]|nr:helix-turn-helix transcriptional regulator [Verrucomicrobiales bacterium]
MDLTNNCRALIDNALRRGGVTKTELSERMGFGKSWVTKLLNGTLKSVSDADARRIEDILGIKFIEIVENHKAVSSLALEIDAAMGHSEQLTKVIQELLPLAQEQPFTPRYLETKEMSAIGQEIIRICFANEDEPGKVAREVLALLSRPAIAKKKSLHKAP